MLYRASHPFLQIAAKTIEKKNKVLVRMKRRPKALAKVKVIPDKHFRFLCSYIKLTDLWLLSLVSKKMTGQYALTVFESTRRMGYLRREKEFLSHQETEKVPFRGAELFVCYYGPRNGKPILLVHGWDANGLMFRHLAEFLAAQGYRVIVPDLPGHGGSGLERASVYDMAEAIARLMKSKGPLHAMIGHSTGGLVGALAISSGLRCNRFVSLGIPSSLGELLDINVSLHQMPRCTRASMGQIYTSGFGKTPEQVGLQMLLDRRDQVLVCHDKEDARVPLEGLLDVYSHFPEDQVFLCNTGSHNGLLKSNDVNARVQKFLSETECVQ